MASTKDIQRRIKSIGATKKITKAMKMVSAAKMRRAIEAVIKTRTYANLSWETVLNLSQANGHAGYVHPLLQKRDKVMRVGIILIASNRGLCGGFNSAIVNKAHKSAEKFGQKDISEFIIIGKRGLSIRKYSDYTIAAEFEKADIITDVREVAPISRMVISDYLSGKYDKIMVAYTDFVNAAKQIPRIKQLLPIDIAAHDEYLGVVGQDTRVGLDKEFVAEKQVKHATEEKYSFEYKFEPDPETVLSEMLPRLIEIQLYQALLEANASEHSARMTAMHQATDAATDMVRELTLSYNKARQAAITSEIAEISAGADSLK